MEQTLTAKIRLYPTAEQQYMLVQSMQAYKDGCNLVSDYVYETGILSRDVLNKALYYRLREAFQLRSQMAQSVIRTVVGSYRSMKANGEWSKAAYKHGFYTLVWNRDYTLKDSCFSVNTIYGRLQMLYNNTGLSHYFDKNHYKFGSAVLIYKHQKFYLCISVTAEFPEVHTDEFCNVVGVDRGINFLAVAYNSKGKTQFYSGKTVKQVRAKYKLLRKELQRRQTPSARRRLKKIGRRENRWMTDVNHQVSKALVCSQPEHTLFVLEDLIGIRSVTEAVKVKDRYTQVSWAFDQLGCFIDYKAVKHHSLCVYKNPAYTSQACPKCGHTEAANRNKKIHLFTCKRCGYRSNDDRIAGMNLHRKGIVCLVPDADTMEHVSIV